MCPSLRKGQRVSPFKALWGQHGMADPGPGPAELSFARQALRAQPSPRHGPSTPALRSWDEHVPLVAQGWFPRLADWA